MRVILAEKPSVARDIARVLGCSQRGEGCYRSATTIVTYAVGHLVRVAEPETMNPDWGKPWRKDQLPMIPAAWRYEVNQATADQFKVVKELFRDSATAEIVNATDAGREGEAIFRRIYELSGSNKPVLRFWASSLTDEAIEEAMKRLQPGANYDALAAAAQVRAQLDWLIGMNYSRAYSTLNHQICSIGRVQTPTLAMIVKRQQAISGFVKTPFYEVHATQGGFLSRALNSDGQYDFDRKAEAEAILTAAPDGAAAEITAVEKKSRRIQPSQLFNLGELQKAANARHGFTADRTLELAQSLYETHKVITYPRSSSRHLSEDMVAGLPAILRTLVLPQQEAHIGTAIARADDGAPLSKRYVDGSKLSDHHALIPTKISPKNLSPDEQKVYELVALRFLGIFLPDKQVEETRIDLMISEKPFRATGSRTLDAGWSVLAAESGETKGAEEEDSSQQLPDVHQGDRFPVEHSELVTKERKPPSRFTDASLLTAMETAGKEIEDEALREAMKKKGLGTEATRAAIIKTLVERGYIERKGKYLEPTAKGVAIIAQVLQKLQSPALTGEMEEKLYQVEEGNVQPESILAKVADDLRRDIPTVFECAPIATFSSNRDNRADVGTTCPKCKQGVMRRPKGKDFYGCSRYREGCTFSVNVIVAQKKLTDKQIEALFQKGKTNLIKGFTAKSGKTFDAFLICSEATGWKANFAFEQQT